MNPTGKDHWLRYERLLNDEAALKAFIETCQQDEQRPARDLTADILQKATDALHREEKEWLTRRRLFAVACFSSAACVMLMTGLGWIQQAASLLEQPTESILAFLSNLF